MSRWTHSICVDCWNKRHPDRLAHHLKPEYAELESCCYCGLPTGDGIYVRDHPDNPPHCKRDHDD